MDVWMLRFRAMNHLKREEPGGVYGVIFNNNNNTFIYVLDNSQI
jgi:hypothetical protein